jgi:hypothetical protein
MKEKMKLVGLGTIVTVFANCMIDETKQRPIKFAAKLCGKWMCLCCVPTIVGPEP